MCTFPVFFNVLYLDTINVEISGKKKKWSKIQIKE